MPARRRRKVRRHARESMARRADRYALYQKSVQSPEHEVAFFRRAFKSAYGRLPILLREDFCGTGAVSCEWVRSHRDRRAIGVDIDPVPLQWGREHNLAKLKPEARSRVELRRGDARRVAGPKADLIAAQNFSFQCFKTRPELKRYFKAARGNLARQGLLFLDLMGGSELLEDDRDDEVKSFRGYKYVWEQKRFDPITHDCEFYIHFRFPDGSKLERAFHYDWRLWTIPEIRELLLEAGFKRADVYWEDTDKRTGKGNDTYRRRERAEADAAWICYIVAVK